MIYYTRNINNIEVYKFLKNQDETFSPMKKTCGSFGLAGLSFDAKHDSDPVNLVILYDGEGKAAMGED